MKTQYSIDGILFDLDGTLCDSSYDLASSANFVRDHFHLAPLTRKEVLKSVGNGLPNLVMQILGTSDENDFKRGLAMFKDHYRQHCMDETTLYPGVTDVLKQFAHKKLGVVSNKAEEFTREILLKLGIVEYFKIVIGGDTTPQVKPSPVPFQLALKALHLQPGKTAMVGDGVQDITGGKAVGLITCSVLYGYCQKDDLLMLKPDCTVESFAQLIELFN